MEVILGIIIGGGMGAVVVWLAMKLRAGSADASLQAALDAANKREEDAERNGAEFKQEIEDLRAQSEESKLEVVRLQTEFDASQKRYEHLEQSNADMASDADELRTRASTAAAANAELQAQLNAANRRLAEQTDIEKTLGDQFKVMANNLLKSNNDEFIKAADEKLGALVTQAKGDFSISQEAVEKMVKPLSDELKRIETARAEAQGSLKEQIEALTNNSAKLQQETGNLVTALQKPQGRGAWGEMQLRRVVELAGMSNYCDFEEQVSVASADGRQERPDMVVRMPNERTIVVDAKAPLAAYLEVIDAETDDDRNAAAEKVSKQVRDRANDLAKKSYWDSFKSSPDFVVMFLPGEFLLPIALEKAPQLLDQIMEQRVVVATPNTLMALLKTVAVGWREAQIAEEAANVASLGRELHERLNSFASHMVRVGASLDSTVKHFNSGVGSLESRVLVSARRFKDMGVSTGGDIQEISEIETQPRKFRSAQLRALPEPDAAGD